MKHVIESSVELELNALTKSHLDFIIDKCSQLGLQVNDAVRMTNPVKIHEDAEEELKLAIETIPRSPVRIRNALLKCRFVKEEMKGDLETLQEYAANILQDIEAFSLRLAEIMVLDIEKQEQKTVEELVHKGHELGVDVGHAENLVAMLRKRSDVESRLVGLLGSNLIGFEKLENLLQEADDVEKETCALLGEATTDARALFGNMKQTILLLNEGIDYLDAEMLEKGVEEASELKLDHDSVYIAKRLKLDVSLLSRRLQVIEQALEADDIPMLCVGLEDYHVLASKVPKDHAERIDIVFQDAVLYLRQHRDKTSMALVKRLISAGENLNLGLLDARDLEKSMEAHRRRLLTMLAVPLVGVLGAIGLSMLQ